MVTSLIDIGFYSMSPADLSDNKPKDGSAVVNWSMKFAIETKSNMRPVLLLSDVRKDGEDFLSTSLFWKNLEKNNKTR